MKIAVIGHVDHGKTSIIEALVKGFEEKTGEKVEFVTVHDNEIDLLVRKQELPKVEELVFEINNYRIEEPFFPKAKHCPKGHERPYKYHR